MSSSFLFLSANTPWVYALANRLAQRDPVRAVRFFDWQVYLSNYPSWPEGPSADALARTTRVMPTGYTGILEPVVRPIITWMIRRWQHELREQSGSSPVVVAPYPYLAPWVRDVPSDRLVYYNLDAYALYRPNRKARIRKQERELVERSCCTLCLSVHQVDQIQKRHPAHADRIHHFPLGVTEAFLNPAPNTPLEPKTVAYVGNLTNRVDWGFVNEVAERCPSLTFVFVGEADAEASEPPWERERTRAFQRANVRFVGRVPQEAVTQYYWSAGVNWIPYDPAHPFNRASCPTKVMDGIGSGRPIISTDVPECRQYPRWIDIVRTPDEAAEALHKAVEREHQGQAQVNFARSNTWADRAETFRQILNGPVSSPA